MAMAIKGKYLLLSVLSGILLICSFPKFGVGVFAWVALVPLLSSLRRKTPSEGFSLGFLTGFIFNVGLLYWIVFVVVMYGYFPLYLGITAMLFVAAYLSLYWALFAAGVVYADGRGIPRIVSAPLIFTCLEYGKSHLLTGFPWENLAYSQYLNTSIIQIADITGIYGITFVIVLVNTVIADCFTTEKGQSKRMVIGELVAASLIFFSLYLYGTFRVAEVNRLLKNAESVNVTLVQGNIDQNIKWNPRYQRETIDAYRSLSLQCPHLKQGLIVWPETAVPFYFQDMDDLHREIVAVARESGAFLLLGSPAYLKDEGGLSFFNSAFLLSPDGSIKGRYDKVHLVPYGEYVPLRKVFPFMNKLVTGVGDFGTGKDFLPLVMNGHTLGTLICYEAIFPAPSRTYKLKGAELLVNITNDAWYGRTSAPYQHLSMTVLRAVESRLFLVRAANTGISAIIDPAGRIVSRTALFERTQLRGEVKFINENTFYACYGDIFIYACMASLIVLLFMSKFIGRNRYARRIS